MKLQEIIDGIIKGDSRVIARAISIIENQQYSEEAAEIIKGIFPHTGKAHIIGITGPPGIGKSTLIGKLAQLLSSKGHKLSVIAVDASSPFSGGSLLGNRIRMQESLSKYGVYMRSLANRGLNGGLSRSTWDTVKILDAAQNEFIIIETVGAGQADLDIVNLADTVVVVLGPGLGDQIQAIKAGIMEIGDVFIINKMDKEGAYLAMKDIEDTIAYSKQGEWKIPVIGTNALTGEGIDDFIDALKKHVEYSKKDKTKKIKRIRRELSIAIDDEFRRKYEEKIADKIKEEEIVESIILNKTDPYTAVRKIIEEVV